MATPDWTKNRHLIYGSAGMAASGLMQSREGEADEESSEAPALEIARRNLAGDGKLGAAIVGNSEDGRFGNGLGTVFTQLPGVQLVAAVDENAEGLEETKERTHALEGYDSIDPLFETEKLDLVCFADRGTRHFLESARTALAAGSHLLVNPPLTETLAEADELLAIADQRGLKIGAALPLATDPHIARFRDMHLRLIGEILEIRVFGKMDERAGGEDLLVNGIHLLDLVRYFAGEVEWCTARIRKGGREARSTEVHESQRDLLGPLLGDDVYAHFAMDSGINVVFQSRKRMREMAGSWGIEFIGTKSRARLFGGPPASISLQRSPDSWSAERSDHWHLWPENDPYHAEVGGLSGENAANRLMVNDWLGSIANAKEPRCSGYRAMKAQEMVHGVWQAALSGDRVQFPMVDREHPLATIIEA